MNVTETEFKYMVESVAVDLTEYLMHDYNLSMSEALNLLYNSTTFEKLSDANTGLYYQSSGYVYAYLQKEIKTGKLG